MNPHARALGRLGGRARAALPADELSRIGRLGGRPRRYRLTPDGALEERHGDTWQRVTPPLTRAQRAGLMRADTAASWKPEGN